MKSLIITLFILFSSISVFAQSESDTPLQNISSDSQVKFRLFATKNMYTFIKLNTRNGKMWQVHFSINNDKFEGQLVLNSNPLVSEEDEIKGRFTLYKTENIYNLLMIDQIDGRVWQVQWNSEQDKRFISRLY